jgi:membrane-bound metal-dependent hydrolase YbcI (DUF457 family)
MFAGHVGAALAIGRAERRVNIGVFVAAALLLDFVLWVLVLLGREAVVIPADIARTHQVHYLFPYSHSLAGGAVWSALAAVLGWFVYARLGSSRVRASLLIAAAVFSHWLLDALVHRPEMPLLGSTSRMVGLGLWNHMPVALAVEAMITVLGLCLFIRGGSLSAGKSAALAALNLIIIAGTVAGLTLAPPPPSGPAMAVTSLLILIAVCALTAWLGRQPRERAA